jgi:hypothetical protein
MLLAMAASSLLIATSASAAPSTPTYIIGNREIEATGGFLTDGSQDAIFSRSGGSWQLIGEGQNQPPDAREYVDLSKPSVRFKSTGGGLYVTHVNYTHTDQLWYPMANVEEYRCYVAIKTNSSNTSATFVGADVNGKQTDGCTDVVQGSIKFSSLTFGTGRIDGEAILGVTIPTCDQTPGTAAYATCTTQRNAALKELAPKIRSQCVADSGGPDGANCIYYRTIEQCLENSERNSVTDCTRRADARAILDGNFSSITAGTTDQDIQDICNELSNSTNRAKCIEAATAERDRLKEDSPEDGTSCAVEGIGWIVCPMITFIGKLNDRAFELLSGSFLEVESSLIADDATFGAWESFRDIANLLFVIAFVVIVYAQMVGGRN